MNVIKLTKNVILLTIILSICFCSFLVNPSFCMNEPGVGGSTSVNGNNNLGLPTLDNGYKPTVKEGRATNIIISILNVLTVLGIIAIVIAIAIMGLGSILGSASEKALKQEQFIGIVIAAGLIAGGSIIAKLIISVAESI